MVSEKSLVHLLQHKDKKVLMQLYDMYGPALYRCIFKITQNETMACKVLEHCFVTLPKRIHSIGPTQKLFNWLMQQAIQQCTLMTSLKKEHIIRRLALSKNDERSTQMQQL